MPLDYRAAAYPAAAGAPAGATIDRSVVAAAVERYLAARGVRTKAPAGPACSCEGEKPAPPASAASVAAEVVDRFLARRGVPGGQGGPGGSPAGGYG